MRKLILVALVAGLMVGADKPKKDGGKDGAMALEGTWAVVSVMDNGRVPDEAKGAKLTIKGTAATLMDMRGEHKATVKIDPKKKTIDLTPDGGSDKTMKGIYQLKGDDLKLCFTRPGKERPKGFTGEKDSGQTLIVLKRAKSE